jgi:hypothetical protein
MHQKVSAVDHIGDAVGVSRIDPKTAQRFEKRTGRLPLEAGQARA